MAIQFNLLPWREELRAKKAKRNKFSLIGAAVVGLLLGAGYYGLESFQLKDHNKALSFIKAQNKALEPKLKEKKRLDALKIELNNQIDSIEALQADRASVTHMVEELSTANTQELYLTRFNLKDGNVTISGVAENDSEISDLMTNLRNSEWYREPELVEIVSDKKLGGEIKKFDITSQLLLPGSDKVKEKQ